MKKFKVYSVLIWIGFVLLTVALFLPISYVSPSLMQIIVVLLYIVYSAFYLFLFAVLNYFKEPLWKKFAVALFLIIQYVPVFFVQINDMPEVWFYSILLCLNVPFVIAFVTIQRNEIHRLAQSLGYTMFLVALMRLLAAITKLDIGIYHTVYSVINTFPTIIAAVMCRKMISISAQENEEKETIDKKIDLLPAEEEV